MTPESNDNSARRVRFITFKVPTDKRNHIICKSWRMARDPLRSDEHWEVTGWHSLLLSRGRIVIQFPYRTTWDWLEHWWSSIIHCLLDCSAWNVLSESSSILLRALLDLTSISISAHKRIRMECLILIVAGSPVKMSLIQMQNSCLVPNNACRNHIIPWRNGANARLLRYCCGQHLSSEKASFRSLDDLLVDWLWWMIHHHCSCLIVDFGIDSGIADEVNDPFLSLVLRQAEACRKIPAITLDVDQRPR